MIRILPFRVPYLDNLGARNSSTLTQHDFDSYLNFLLFELDFLGKYIYKHTYALRFDVESSQQANPTYDQNPSVCVRLVSFDHEIGQPLATNPYIPRLVRYRHSKDEDI